VRDQWRVIVAIWVLGIVGVLVGCVLYFLPYLGPAEALRWGLYVGTRYAAGLSVFGVVLTVMYLMVRPDGPRGPRGSGPMSPAG
jgi:hypothetical protein